MNTLYVDTSTDGTFYVVENKRSDNPDPLSEQMFIF